MGFYEVPQEYFFRIHHCRSRFKDEYENILVFMASEISNIPEMGKKEFSSKLNEAIKKYGKNSQSTQKTIDNWRTEISSLFGFLEFSGSGEDRKVRAGNRTKELAEHQDIVEFFKKFLFTFQYPGAHISKQAVYEQITKGVRFKPAQYILKVLEYAESVSGKREYLTKAETCHCIFNDLRCTRDNESPQKVWERIQKNRNEKVEYDETGDVIRYAGDILSYMECANLLVCHDHKHFYSNKKREPKMVDLFIKSPIYFDGYDELYIETHSEMVKEEAGEIPLLYYCYKKIDEQYDRWFAFVNQDFANIDFRTSIDAILTIGSDEYIKAKKEALEKCYKQLEGKENIRTKETGDYGEDRIYLYEALRVSAKRNDIIHIINPIPTKFAVGYDIQSVEIEEPVSYKKRYIEVKTTIVKTKLSESNYRFHLTPNEISTAETVGEHYYVYRLIVNKGSIMLYIIKNPIKLFNESKIRIDDDGNGADVIFDHNDRSICSYEELEV